MHATDRSPATPPPATGGRDRTPAVTGRPTRATGLRDARTHLRRCAAVTAATMAVLYGSIAAGWLSVGRADTGELGVLGAAAAVFTLLAVLLWTVAHRVVWLGAALLQLALAAMYVAIAPERVPAYEVWGLTLRGLSIVLLVALVALLVDDRRGRRAAP